jgi:hypothetical protein
MKPIHQILDLLDLGSDVAENDSGLLDYFVETTDFKTILSGTVDVIRGHKGLGKSAIYRSLMSGRFDPPNVLIIDASDATSSDLFRATQAVEKTEDQFKLLWTAHIATIAGNEVLRTMPETPHDKEALKQIRDFLKYIGLLKESRKGTLLDTVRRAKSFAVGIGVSEEGLPSLNFSVELDRSVEKALVSEQHFLDLIGLCVEVLRNSKKCLWITLDRLDELFTKGSLNESSSLRALFRSHLTICAIRHGQTEVRPKIFIRTDIYDRITRHSGFTNVTHFRDLNIIWNGPSILALVSKRVLANADIRRSLSKLGFNVEDPKSVWSALAPETIQSKRSNIWIAKATTDSSGAFNPRNYIALLSLSAKKNHQLLRSNPLGSYGDTILSMDSIMSSFGELSRKRLDDTVLAEFPSSRPFIDRLRGGVAAFDSRVQFATAIGLPSDKDPELEAAIDLLVETGVLKRVTHSTFSIAYMYRPALRVGDQERSNRKDIDSASSFGDHHRSGLPSAAAELER